MTGVRLHAWPCFRIPQSNNLIALMNTSFLFAQHSHWEEKRDVDFLVALSLMSGRKFIQASEHFRKMELDLINNIHLNNHYNYLEKAI